jgi:hypothetical protein
MLTNIRRALAALVSICNLHVIFFIKNYTEIFHVVYKVNLPFFQSKLSLDCSASMEEADGLSLNIIDLYVPALTPRLHCGDTALQFSENIPLFAICFVCVSIYTHTHTHTHTHTYIYHWQMVMGGLGLVFLLGWTQDEATLHSLPTKFKPKPDEIFCGLFCYHRMTEW